MRVERSTVAIGAIGALVILVSLASLTGGLQLGLGSNEGPQFREMGAEAGLYYDTTRTRTFGNGLAGVYVTDYNNDRRPDVLAIGGREPILFENTDGAFEKTNTLPDLDIDVKGALFLDYDNDGWEDLLLLPVRGEAVFLENRNGSFHKRDVGLNTEMHIAIGASAADYNQDGCLDLFVIQSGDWRQGVPKAAKPSQSHGEDTENDNGNPNLLFEGDCNSFKRVEDAGIKGTRWSLATSFVDLTGDGYPDIHIGNDFNTDVLYVNQQNGTFRRGELPDTDRHAMASEVADVNRDGRPDVFVSNIHFDERVWGQKRVSNADNRGNNLLINHGNGRFTSEEQTYGVQNSGWGWAAAMTDLDNDGDRDLVHTTKYNLRDTDGDGSQESVETQPRMWERTGENFTRLNASAVGFETSSGRGLAQLDYDQDGDQDLIVANNVGPFKLYENRANDGNWLQITLESDDTHTTIGTQVYVTTDDTTHSRMHNAKADFLSQDSRTLHVGLGEHETVTVRVVWPDGTEQVLEGISVNRRLVITRNGSARFFDASRNTTEDSP